MGRLTRDPETKVIPNSDTFVTEISLALNEVYKDNERVSFVDCTAFGKTAETIAKFFKKGKPILVDGKLRQETWETDGQKRSKLVVIIDNFSFIDSDNKASETKETKQPVQNAAANSNKKVKAPF